MKDRLALRDLARTIGSEVTGVDLRRLDDATFAAIESALLDRKVLVFPAQRLEPEDHLAFARRFGELEPPHPVFAHLAEHPQVSVLENRDGKGVNNDEWHTDVSFRERPALGSILHARVIPPIGGDTLWADMEAAYDALAAPLRDLIDGLHAVHDVRGGGPYGRVPSYREIVLAGPDGPAALAAIQRDYPPALHPVARTHPVTGRRALFVNRSFTTHVAGLSKLESWWLLGLLLEHAEQASFQVRHRWREDDVVVWDNRCTIHLATADYAPAHRRMHRVTVLGDRPI